jgi:DNA-binding transcriptional ArsR family regulator
MSLEPIVCSAIPTRGKPHGDFAWQDNELYEVFQPLIGPHAVSVYATLTRRAYPGQKIRYSVRDLAAKTGQSPATVSRSLEILEDGYLLDSGTHYILWFQKGGCAGDLIKDL